MKITFLLFCISLLVTAPQKLHADEEPAPSDVLAQRGKGVVLQSTFAARVDRIPEDQRQATLRDQTRLQDILNSLLINAQLAADARAAGFEADPVVIDRMKLAAETELAAAWLDHYVASQSEADYEQLAREYYLLNQETMMSPERIDVSHILITTQEREESEAEELANSLYAQLLEEPTKFDPFVMEFSEDPSAKSNRGKFYAVKPGDMDKSFEKAAFALQEGETSAPVKSRFGYHIIRLDARTPPAKMSFDEVKARLIERERKKHMERVKRDYLGRLTSIDVIMTKEALDEMFRRQFGDEILESQGSTTELE